jgi:transposase
MPSCPRCKSDNTRKNGKTRGRQKYLCKECGYSHSVEYKWYSEEFKQRALELYLEGLGFRSIARFLGCSHVAVYNWIKEYGKKADVELPVTEIETVEMDEMHSYVGSKKALLDMDSRRQTGQTFSEYSRWLT